MKRVVFGILAIIGVTITAGIAFEYWALQHCHSGKNSDCP